MHECNHTASCQCITSNACTPFAQVVLSIGTFSIAMFSAVAGMLGENLELPTLITSNVWGFAIVNIGAISLCLMVFRWCRAQMTK